MKPELLFSTFGVLELHRGCPTHADMMKKLVHAEARAPEHDRSALSEDATLTLVMLPELESEQLSTSNRQRIAQAMAPVFTGQYCLATGGDPSIETFFSKDGQLSGIERVHLFAHWTIRIINEAGTHLLDNDGRPVIDRFCRYGKHTLALIYFGSACDLGRFLQAMKRFWQAFNDFLSDETQQTMPDVSCACLDLAEQLSRTKRTAS